MKNIFFRIIFFSLMTVLFSVIACEDEAESKTVTVFYSVVFETTGGSTVAIQKVAEGKCAVLPENPVKTTSTGKKYFGGWYTDEIFSEEAKFDFSTPITKDIVLYAKWNDLPENSWLVKFITGTQTSVADQIVKDGECASEPQEKLTKTGYAFGWWYHNDEKQEYDFSSNPITESTELTAKWNESGIYEAAYEDDTPFCMNIYDSLEPDTESGAW